MSKTGIKTFTPVLLKRFTEKIPLYDVQVRVKVSRKRDIRLLEWALLAPVASITPKPGITDIAKKLGISKQEFLEVVAKKLVVLGMMVQLDSDHYELTPRGEKLFREGKVISDPEDQLLSISYEPGEKEWLVGFRLPRLKDDEDYSDIVDLNNLILSDLVIHQHGREIKAIEKGDEVLDSQIEGVRIRELDVSVRLILQAEGLEFKTDGLSDDVDLIISRSVKSKLSTDGCLTDHLSDFIELGKAYSNVEKVKPYEIADSRILPVTDVDTEISRVLQDKPKWAMANLASVINKVMSAGTKVIVAGLPNHQNVFKAQASRDQVILFDDHVIGSNLLITDKWLLKIVNVVCEESEIPVLVINNLHAQTQYQDSLTGLINCQIGENKISAYLARFYLVTNRTNYDSLVNYVLQNPGRPDTPTIKDLMGIKKLLGDNSYSEVELSLYKSLLSTYSLDRLLKNEDGLSTLLSSLCKTRVSTLIRFDLDKNTIKEIIRNYDQISKKFEKCDSSLKPILNEAISDTLVDVTSDLGRFGRDKSAENISNSFKLMDLILSSERKNAVGEYILMLIRDTDSSAESMRSWYFKLKDRGYTLDISDAERLCRKMVEELDFKWFSSESVRKIENINVNCKKLSSEFTSVSNYFNLPDVSGYVSNKQEIRGLLDNLIGLSNIYNELDNAYLKDILGAQEDYLRTGSPDKSLDLLLNFIDIVRKIERSKEVQYLTISDDFIVDTVLCQDDIVLKKHKNVLESLGLLNIIKARQKTLANDSANAPLTSPEQVPPLKKIVVDGSNVAWQGQDGKVPLASQIIVAYSNLKRSGFETILIILDASLRHKLGLKEYEDLQEFFKNEITEGTPDILLVAPAETRADEFIIKNAISNDMMILSNDMYRDFRTMSADYEQEIRKRLIKYMFNPLNTNELQLSYDPEKIKEAVN